jgi:signal transduction histidine kinase
VDSVIRQKHGGSIDIDSELGRGTTFRLILPLAAEDAMLAA